MADSLAQLECHHMQPAGAVESFLCLVSHSYSKLGPRLLSSDSGFLYEKLFSDGMQLFSFKWRVNVRLPVSLPGHSMSVLSD